MNYKNILTDELVDIREVERLHNNYEATDAIRNELDSRGSFVVDTANGQVIYHMGSQWSNKRKEFLKDIRDIDAKFKRYSS